MKFIDNRKDTNKLLIVLAGYKQDIWDSVFARLNKYIDKDINVCIVTSGLLSKPLMKLCKKNKWSYLGTDINNLCMAQNDCIRMFPEAQFIFKMDEDMFVTKDCFSTLYNDFLRCKDEYSVIPSIIVPVINVNCVTYFFMLKSAGLLEDFRKKTGIRPMVTNGLHHSIDVLESPKMSTYMWEHFDIDTFKMGFVDMMPSPIRFSIGLMMMTRNIWEELGGFPVDLNAKEEYRRIGLGEDEKALCKFAMNHAKPIMIDFNTCVGHLGYGPQTKEMIKFYKSHKHLFDLKS